MGSHSPDISSASGESKQRILDLVADIDEGLRQLAGKNLPLECEQLIAYIESRVMELRKKLK